jgi:AbiU2
LFGPLQLVLSNACFLSVAKVFEKPSKKYATRSIPSVLELLKRSADELVIGERTAMMRRLATYGMKNVESLAAMSDSEITSKIVQFYATSLPSTFTESAMSKSLRAVVTRRDKVVAHNEMIDRSTLPQLSWAEIERLISYAKRLIDVVGIGYISRGFADDDGRYCLTSDANRAARVLKKLLMKADMNV